MKELTGKALAQRITVVLAYLKSIKITQAEVELQLNYTSLSKAKNYERYPQAIIEKKTRAELLDLLYEQFDIEYDEVHDEVIRKLDARPKKSVSQNLLYIMYYYAFARETVGKAIVRVINKKKVYIDYPMNEHWVGTYEVIENYTFIQAEKKGDTTPVKKLICLFSGTEKYGRPILLGSYSTVKRDGYPAAGNVVFELMADEKMVDATVRSEVDSRIAYYLHDKVLIAETFTPNSLNDLTSDFKHIEKYANQYKMYYEKENEVLEAELEFLVNGSAQIVISSITYQGIFKILDSHTIKVLLKDASEFSHLIKEEISILIQTNVRVYAPFYFGNGITNALAANQSYFNCLILPEKEVKNTTSEKARSLLLSLSS
ncbi:MAG: hypothetical protein RIG62_13765 [Cyclobacteriaceae bacterium]